MLSKARINDARTSHLHVGISALKKFTEDEAVSIAGGSPNKLMPEQQRNGFCKVEASHRLRYLGHRSSYGGVSHGGDAGLVVGFRRCKPNRLPICVLIGNAEKR